MFQVRAGTLTSLGLDKPVAIDWLRHQISGNASRLDNPSETTASTS
nr:hypothetical protein [Paracoccus saliphilus]